MRTTRIADATLTPLVLAALRASPVALSTVQVCRAIGLVFARRRVLVLLTALAASGEVVRVGITMGTATAFSTRNVLWRLS